MRAPMRIPHCRRKPLVCSLCDTAQLGDSFVRSQRVGRAQRFTECGVARLVRVTCEHSCQSSHSISRLWRAHVCQAQRTVPVGLRGLLGPRRHGYGSTVVHWTRPAMPPAAGNSRPLRARAGGMVNWHRRAAASDGSRAGTRRGGRGLGHTGGALAAAGHGRAQQGRWALAAIPWPSGPARAASPICPAPGPAFKFKLPVAPATVHAGGGSILSPWGCPQLLFPARAAPPLRGMPVGACGLSGQPDSIMMRPEAEAARSLTASRPASRRGALRLRPAPRASVNAGGRARRYRGTIGSDGVR